MRRNPRPPRPHPTESETELENEGLEIGVNEHCRGESTRKSKGAIAPPPLKRENGITKEKWESRAKIVMCHRQVQQEGARRRKKEAKRSISVQ